MRSAICNQSWVSIWEFLFFVILDPFVFLGISAKVIPNERTNESRSSLYVYNPAGYAIKEEEEEENGADEYRQAAQGENRKEYRTRLGFSLYIHSCQRMLKGYSPLGAQLTI